MNGPAMSSPPENPNVTVGRVPPPHPRRAAVAAANAVAYLASRKESGMLTEPTLEKLKTLRLDAFAAAWLTQQQDPALAAVPFDERLGLLVEAEGPGPEKPRQVRGAGHA